MVNWIDAAIVLVPVSGMAIGAQRGIVRQLILMGAFYLSLVIAARYYGQAAGVVVSYVPRADPTVASAYSLAGLTIGGTLLLGLVFRQAYGSTKLLRLRAVDRLAGAGLGAAWSWAVLAFAVTILLYGVSFTWGPNEWLRGEIESSMAQSVLVSTLRGTLPHLHELLAPWLPGGLPAPLSV